ncbi:MAG: LacI family DNA-binding transcriptional regulator, partial [Pseudomonadota bacterium]
MTPRKHTKRITISDVAKRAGVSSMTVSRVLNSDAKVKRITREKVEAVISELNYAPNIAARSLAGTKVNRICLLYGNPSSAYLGELLLGALAATSDAGALLIVERTTAALSPASLAKHFDHDWDALIVPPPMSDIEGIRKIVAKCLARLAGDKAAVVLSTIRSAPAS